MAKYQIGHQELVSGARRGRFAALTQRIVTLDENKDFEEAFERAFKDALDDFPRLRAGSRKRSTGASFRSA